MEAHVSEREVSEAQAKFLATHGVDPSSRRFTASVEGRKGPEPVQIHVLEMGSGPPLLLLHGGGGLAAGWASLMAELSGFRLIAPDRPGGCLSDGFDYRGVDLRAHAVSFVESVFDASGVDRAIVVANSMGARWAIWHALAHPSRVLGIAALGIPAFLLETSAPMPMRLLGRPVLGRWLMKLDRPSPKQAGTLMMRMGHDADIVTPELARLFVALQESPGFSETWRTLLGNCLGLGGARPGMSITAAELEALTVPIVLAIGANDPFGAAEVGERASRLAKDGSFAKLGVGHLPWLDDPRAAAKIVRELAMRVSPASEVEGRRA